MKKTIIVTTDFSTSSRNALEYACGIIGNAPYKLLLVHIFTMPVNYTSDGIALAAIRDTFDIAEDRLTREVSWVHKQYPAIEISSKAVTGGLVASLKEEIVAQPTEIVVMGAANDYDNLWEWDSELLSALTNLPIPVLLIPKQIKFTRIQNIGFACDYRNVYIPQQIAFIKWLTSYTHAQLHIVHITRAKLENEDVQRKNEGMLQEALAEVAPKYYTIEDPHVIDAAAQFVKDHKLDFLIVIPHKHDVWYSIFHQSHTKQLARLNGMPILALHD